MTESKGIRKKQVGVLVYGERKNERGRKKTRRKDEDLMFTKIVCWLFIRQFHIDKSILFV